jgi:hypothetical protein
MNGLGNPNDVSMDLLGGRPHPDDEEHEREENLDHYGNGM